MRCRSSWGSSIPTINAGAGIVTHVNAFTTTPDKHQALVDSLTETVKFASTLPGWISASVHKSYDGTKVINYVQFESHAAAQNVTRELIASGWIQRNTALGKVEPGQYEFAFTLES